MAASIQIQNKYTGEIRWIYTVDAKELLRGENEDGWTVFDPARPVAEASSAPKAVRRKQQKRQADGEGLAEAERDAGPVGTSAGFPENPDVAPSFE